MHSNVLRGAGLCLALALSSGVVCADVLDPVGDYLSTYTGPHNGDMDVTKADVSFNGQAFLFSGTLNGPIGTTPGALYVFGLDRGKGTARFDSGTPALAPSILFDSVLIIRPNTTAAFNDFIANQLTPLPTGSVAITGDSFSAVLPLSLFPSEGFQPSQYSWDFWPRIGLGQNTQISDFAPNAANANVSSTPEPSSTALMMVGLMAGGLSLFVVQKRGKKLSALPISFLSKSKHAL